MTLAVEGLRSQISRLTKEDLTAFRRASKRAEDLDKISGITPKGLEMLMRNGVDVSDMKNKRVPREWRWME